MAGDLVTTSIKLFDFCQRIRPELACLGELGRPLLDVVTVIERLGGTQTITVLSQPGFALDVLTAGNGSDAASVGRVLDFLRIRADAGPATTVTTGGGVTVFVLMLIDARPASGSWPATGRDRRRAGYPSSPNDESGSSSAVARRSGVAPARSNATSSPNASSVFPRSRGPAVESVQRFVTAALRGFR